MRAIFFCVILLFVGLVTQAQTNIASLNITLTDVQSVTFTNAALAELVSGARQTSEIGQLNVLSNSTSQIKKISSKNSEYEKLYKEFYNDKAITRLSSSSEATYNVALNSASSAKKPLSRNISNLVIYQVDPR